jgi:hypothetical protein
MIPPNQALKARMTSNLLARTLLADNEYFETAEEFVRMNKVFTKDSLLERIMIWVDMVISPLITLFTAVYYREVPSVFTIMGLYKTITLWNDWVYLQILKGEIHEWMDIVRSIGGPFIATNDPTYHVYVYADGMQRIYNCWFLPKN